MPISPSKLRFSLARKSVRGLLFVLSRLCIDGSRYTYYRSPAVLCRELFRVIIGGFVVARPLEPPGGDLRTVIS